jgi:cell division protein ZapA (FtsZ GTPase activity inhibitor)
VNKIDRVIIDGKEYDLGKQVDKVFFAGDSFDRSVQYAVPAMECEKSKVKFNASPQDIYVYDQSLGDYITTVATRVSSSADCYLDNRLSTLESKTNMLESKVAHNVAAIDTIDEITSYLGANDSVVSNATSAIDELKVKFAEIADQLEGLTKVEKKKLAGYTPEWYKCKRELRTRRKNEFKIEELLTI